MDRLPYELWRQILEPLSDEEIINLPLSIAYNGLSQSDLIARFQTIENIWIHEPCLVRLLEASRHPLIGPVIEELQFVPDRIENVSMRDYRQDNEDDHRMAEHWWKRKTIDEETWKMNGMFTRIYSRHQPTLSVVEGTTVPQWPCCAGDAVERRYARYWKAYRAQEEFSEQEKDVKLLTRAMKSLPSVESILIINDAYDGEFRNNVENILGDAWCSPCDNDPVDDCGTYLLKVIVKSLAASGLHIRDFRSTPRWYDYGDRVLDLAELSTALQRAPSQFAMAFKDLVILHLRSIYYSPTHVDLYRAWRKYPGRYTSCERSARAPEDDEGVSSRTMDLRWSEYDEVTSTDDVNDKKRDPALIANGNTKALAAILSSCHQVEDLALQCVSHPGEQKGCPQSMPYLPLLKMLGSNRLTKLRKLDIAKFQVEEEQLVGSLHLYSSTLQDLMIDDIVLDRGTWESVLARLRAKLHLSSGRFKDMYGKGPQMRALAKSYGMNSCPGRFEWYSSHPWLFSIPENEAVDYLRGKSHVNPIRKQMLERKAGQVVKSSIGYGSDDDVSSYDSD